MSFDTSKVKKSAAPAVADDPTTLGTGGLKLKDAGDKKWSAQQQAIFKAFAGKGNLIVEALAGTGKTTTIVEGLKYLKGKVLVCAFNKRIATELQQRITSLDSVKVSTLHGLGFGLLRRHGSFSVDNSRGLRLAEAALYHVGGPKNRSFFWTTHFIAQSCKEISPYVSDVESVIKIAQAYGHLDGVDERYYQKIAEATLTAMDLAVAGARDRSDLTLDFSDMIFLPLKIGLTHGEYDVVVVDEAQDMNRTQLELAERVMKKDGRIIVVGDSHQAIYGFRGADSQSMSRLKKAFNAKSLPLNITYRCPSSVVALARHLVPDFTGAPSCPAGKVRDVGYAKLYDEAQPGDFILGRVNAPLLSACLALVAKGKPARMAGRDIGKSLVSLIRKLDHGSYDYDSLDDKIRDWEAKQVKKAKDDADAIKAAQDKAFCILMLMESAKDVQGLINMIEKLFTDVEGADNTAIICSTVHKAKGLEADRVYILHDTFSGSWEERATHEEGNIKYVAITRAKKELVWVGRLVPRKFEKEDPMSGVPDVDENL
jgi:DNA helicase-2/ATP-dependent DNA helicase PcrA